MTSETDSLTVPQVRQSARDDGTRRIELTGPWLLRSILPHAKELQLTLTEYASDSSVEWDLREIQQLDGAG